MSPVGMVARGAGGADIIGEERPGEKRWFVAVSLTMPCVGTRFRPRRFSIHRHRVTRSGPAAGFSLALSAKISASSSSKAHMAT